MEKEYRVLFKIRTGKVSISKEKKFCVPLWLVKSPPWHMKPEKGKSTRVQGENKSQRTVDRWKTELPELTWNDTVKTERQKICKSK
jgi:hypothetical protein